MTVRSIVWCVVTDINCCCYCRIADLVLYAVFRLVSTRLHYDQGRGEFLQRLSADCNKVVCVCVVCVCMCVCVCVCLLGWVHG